MTSSKDRYQLLDADGEHLRYVRRQEAQRLTDFGYVDAVLNQPYQLQLRSGGTRQGALSADDSRAGAGIYGECSKWRRDRIEGFGSM